MFAFSRFASMSPSFPLRRAPLVATQTPAKGSRTLTRILYCNVVFVFPSRSRLEQVDLARVSLLLVKASTALFSVLDAAVSQRMTVERCLLQSSYASSNVRPQKEGRDEAEFEQNPGALS